MSDLKAIESAYVLGLVDDIAEEGIISKIKDKMKAKGEEQNKKIKEAQRQKQQKNVKEITCEEFAKVYVPKYEACAKEIISTIKRLKKDKKAQPWSKVVSFEEECEWYDDDIPFVYIYREEVDDPDQKLTEDEEELCEDYEESGHKYFNDELEKIADKHNMELGGTSYSTCISTKDKIKVVGSCNYKDIF